MPLTFSIAQAITVATEAPAAQTINMASSPDPVAANNLAAATADDQEAVSPSENQVSDVLATGETVTDGIVETEGLTVIDAAATVIPLEEGVAVSDDTVLEAAAAANGETDTLAPAADIIINNVATDATVVQTVPSIVPVVEGEIVDTEAIPNEVIAEAVITDTATGEGILLTVKELIIKGILFKSYTHHTICMITTTEISTHFLEPKVEHVYLWPMNCICFGKRLSHVCKSCSFTYMVYNYALKFSKCH